MANQAQDESVGSIAIIGMSGRFAGARNISEFWDNLREGKEAITFFSEEELTSSGIAAELVSNTDYVRAGSVVEGIDLFDAEFFGFSPREAEVTDPQQRLFLECAWEALENAGYESDSFLGAIGVFAGVSMSNYLLNVYSIPELVNSAGGFRTLIGNDRDYLPTLVSYKLNLRGPSVNVQTACSTSLVAVHLACQSLLDYQSDLAIAGGVSISVPQRRGYIYEKGGLNSPDGHCRAFDARAGGTVGGNGLGIVVLKRLEEAIADGDFIWSVIKGSAINNDGSAKIGFTAPSVEGQANVILAAQAIAEVGPETIGFVEGHGSGTPLGDPIEVAALTRAFQSRTAKRGYCALGSVKTNLGHLGVAAGIAGLIKAVLAVKLAVIPPSLHFEKANPEIDFERSAFYVNSRACEWTAGDHPRRAGVSSFGIGGTNAHLIIEQAPETPASGPSRPLQLLLLSARSRTALERATDNLAGCLKERPDINLADSAYTLMVGRKSFSHRRAIVCEGAGDAVSVLEGRYAHRLLESFVEGPAPPVIFMFPGLGDHYIDMARGLYESEATFRAELDRCLDIAGSLMGTDLKKLIYPVEVIGSGRQGGSGAAKTARQGTLDFRKMVGARDGNKDPGNELNRTLFAQPALFAVEYSLARLWMEWGVRPEAMIGYSIGEYSAACLAGVLAVEDALRLVAGRAQLIESVEPGSMLAVAIGERELAPLLNDEISIAGINGPNMCIVAGTSRAAEELKRGLGQRDIISRELTTSHAFHSRMMDGVAESFARMVGQVKLNPPKIPYISNVTGTWIKADEATDPEYWARHMCQTVRFSEGLQELFGEDDRVFLEVGPGQMLSTVVVQQQAEVRRGVRQIAIPSIRSVYDRASDLAYLLNAAAHLWLAGVQLEWKGFCRYERRHRLVLPGYPFERASYWVGPEGDLRGPQPGATEALKSDRATHTWYGCWEHSAAIIPALKEQSADRDRDRCWLLLMDDSGFAELLRRTLAELGQEPVALRYGPRFEQVDEHTYTIDPTALEGWDLFARALRTQGKNPHSIVHMWAMSLGATGDHDETLFERIRQLGIHPLLSLIDVLGGNGDALRRVAIILTESADVAGEDRVVAEKGVLAGLAASIGRLCPNVKARAFDIMIPPAGNWQERRLVDRMVSDIWRGSPAEEFVAYRGGSRWVRGERLLPASSGLELGACGRVIIGNPVGNNVALVQSFRQALELPRAVGECSSSTNQPTGNGFSPVIPRTKRGSQRAETIGAGEAPASETVNTAYFANEEELRLLIEQAEEQSVPIEGVIYLVPPFENGKGGSERLEERLATIASHAKAAVDILRGLEKVFTSAAPDYFLVISLRPGEEGEWGQAGEEMAWSLIETFVKSRAAVSPARWLSVRSSVNVPPEEVVNACWRALECEAGLNLVLRRTESGRRAYPAKPDEAPGRGTTLSSHSRPALRNPYVAPTNDAERAIASIWQELLGLDQIGVNDNFFQLGGDSLMGIRLTGRLRSFFEIDLPFRSLVESPTIASLAIAVEECIIGDVERGAGA